MPINFIMDISVSGNKPWQESETTLRPSEFVISNCSLEPSSAEDIVCEQ